MVTCASVRVTSPLALTRRLGAECQLTLAGAWPVCAVGGESVSVEHVSVIQVMT